MGGGEAIRRTSCAARRRTFDLGPRARAGILAFALMADARPKACRLSLTAAYRAKQWPAGPAVPALAVLPWQAEAEAQLAEPG
jgi:hypothetical protein